MESLNLSLIAEVIGYMVMIVVTGLAIFKAHDVIVDYFYNRELKKRHKEADGDIVITPPKPHYWLKKNWYDDL